MVIDRDRLPLFQKIDAKLRLNRGQTEMKARLQIVSGFLIVILMISSGMTSAVYHPNDPRWNEPADPEMEIPDDQWGPEQIDVDFAWDLPNEGTLTNPGTKNIVIAILDTGLLEHEDIPEECLWTNPNEVVGDGGDLHWPGDYDEDEDGDGLKDFNDTQVGGTDWNGRNGPLWGANKRPDAHWDGQAWVHDPLGPHDDDLDDYYLAEKDDDENGYWDDIHGWNFVNLSSDYTDTHPLYHGTHVASAAIATIDNELGIAGIAQVSIMILKTLDDDGNPAEHGESPNTWWSDEGAIKYATNQGADIISISFGYGCLGYTFLDDELEDAVDAGVVCFACAGNTDGGWADYPGYSPFTICVGSSTPEDPVLDNDPDHHRSQESAVDPKIDILAPGGGSIDLPGDEQQLIDDIYCANGPNSDDYEYSHGTSLATPITAAVAALMLSYRPSLTQDDVRGILTGTAVDITNETGLRFDEDATFGKDDYSGYGEVSAFLALSYAVGLRNDWTTSENIIQDSSILAGEMNQPSISLDTEGFSHMVWIDDSNGFNEVFYASVDPSGSIWTQPKSVETAFSNQFVSIYPDICIDMNDDIHISWIDVDEAMSPEGYNIVDKLMSTDEYYIYYTKMDTDGTVMIPPWIVDISTNEKEYINIWTDISCKPRILYAVYDGNDWDIWQQTFHITTWIPNEIIIDNDIDQRKPSLDVQNMGAVNHIYVAYQQRTGPSDDWEIWAWNSFGQPQKWQVTDNNEEDINPNLCVVQSYPFFYVVWQRDDDEYISGEGEFQNRLYDRIFISAFYTNTLEPFIYGTPTGSQSHEYQVGKGVEDNEPNPNNFKEFPKVSAVKVINNRGSQNEAWAIQVNVVWRQDVQMYWSPLSFDGRPLKWSREEPLFPLNIDGIPQIIASDIKDSNEFSDWFDCDGNFRVLIQEDNPQHIWPPIIDLHLSSTREFWDSPSSLSTNVANIGSKNNIHMDVDPSGGLHVVFDAFHTVLEKDLIYYGYWGSGNRNSTMPDKQFSAISNFQHDCVKPMVTALSGGFLPEVIIIYRDESVGNGDLWFQRRHPFWLIRSEPLGCINLTDQTYPPFNTRIVNDMENQYIGITWTEHEAGPPNRNYDIHFGVVDYDNIAIISETHRAVVGTTSVDNLADIAVDTTGDFHIVYQYNGEIYYNSVDIDAGTSTFTKNHENDIQVSFTENKASYPAIAIDRDIQRRDVGIFNTDYDELGRTNRFIHITYTRYRSDYSDYILRYVKLNDYGEIIIIEKDVLDLPLDRSLYSSEIQIISRIALNSDNQVAIVYSGKISHGTNWPALNSHWGIFFTKLDNNGEVLTIETYISGDPSEHGMSATVDYSDTDRLEIVWRQKSSGPWEVFYRGTQE